MADNNRAKSSSEITDELKGDLRSILPSPMLVDPSAFEPPEVQHAFLQECRALLSGLICINYYVEALESLHSQTTQEERNTHVTKFNELFDTWGERGKSASEARSRVVARTLVDTLSKVFEGESEFDKAKIEAALISANSREEAAEIIAKLYEQVYPDEALSASELLDETKNETQVGIEELGGEFAEAGCWEKPLFIGQLDAISQNLEVLDGFPSWHFWHSLLSKLVSGEKPNFGLLSAVAQIDDGVWNSGILELQEEIEAISAELLIDEAGLVEELYFDENSERIARKTPPSANGKSLDLTIAAVADDLDEAVRGNYLSEETYIVRVLKKTITVHASNPERVEMDLVKVGKNLRSQIDKGDLPDSPEIEGLHDTCITGALDIRAHHPDIAEARAKRSLQAIREATEEEKAKLSSSFETIRSISQDDLADDIIDDLEEIIDGRAVTMSGDSELTTDAIARSGSRLAKMWLITKVVAVSTTAGAGAIVTFDAALPILKGLWPLLMNLLGL